jgi:hypothetical protein
VLSEVIRYYLRQHLASVRSNRTRTAVKVPYHARFSGLFLKFLVRGAAARAGVDRWTTTQRIMVSSGQFDVSNCERNTTHEFVSQPESDLVPLMMTGDW